jgi:hypothetical protein
MTFEEIIVALLRDELDENQFVFWDGSHSRPAPDDVQARHARWMDGDETAMSREEALQLTTYGLLRHAWGLPISNGRGFRDTPPVDARTILDIAQRHGLTHELFLEPRVITGGMTQ